MVAAKELPRRGAAGASLAAALGAISFALAAFNLVSSAPARAQAVFPTKPVQIVLTLGVGGPADLATRLLAGKLSELWGQGVVVENKVGAAGVLGSSAVAKAAPDGYTLLMTPTSHVQNPATRKDLPYDTVKDFAPISQIYNVPQFFVVDAKLPAKTLKEYLDYARSHPEAAKFGSYGVGTTAHLVVAKLNYDTKAGLIHVPYPQIVAAMQSVLAGETQSALTDFHTARQNAEAGKVRILAATGSKRSAFEPTIPTFEESGISGFPTDAWAGLFAPGGTPEPILEKISADVLKVMAMPDVKAKLNQLTVEPVGSTRAEWAAVVNRDIAYWKQLIADTGLKLE